MIRLLPLAFSVNVGHTPPDFRSRHLLSSSGLWPRSTGKMTPQPLLSPPSAPDAPIVPSDERNGRSLRKKTPPSEIQEEVYMEHAPGYICTSGVSCVPPL